MVVMWYRSSVYLILWLVMTGGWERNGIDLLETGPCRNMSKANCVNSPGGRTLAELSFAPNEPNESVIELQLSLRCCLDEVGCWLMSPISTRSATAN